MTVRWSSRPSGASGGGTAAGLVQPDADAGRGGQAGGLAPGSAPLNTSYRSAFALL